MPETMLQPSQGQSESIDAENSSVSTPEPLGDEHFEKGDPGWGIGYFTEGNAEDRDLADVPQEHIGMFKSRVDADAYVENNEGLFEHGGWVEKMRYQPSSGSFSNWETA